VPPPSPAPASDPPPAFAHGDVERALVTISRFLVSSAGADLDRVLALLGDALAADAVYFALAPDSVAPPPPPDGFAAQADAPSYLAGRVLVWTRDGRGDPSDVVGPAPAFPGERDPGRVCLIDRDDGRRALAVPLLAEDDRFVGYLGIEREALDGADGDVPFDQTLSVLGDVLGTHLGRLAAEEARQQTEERWRALVEHHPDPTLVWVRGTVRYANAAAAHALGADDPTDLRDRPFEDFLSAADVEAVAARQVEQLEAAHPRPFEHAVVRLDGDERIVEAVCIALPGVPGGVQCVLRDVTDRKDSEERYRTFVETISEGVWRVELDRPISRHAAPRVQAEHVLAHGRVAELNPTMLRMFWGHVPVELPLSDLLGEFGPPLFRAFAAAEHRLLAHEIAVRRDGKPPRHYSVNAVGRFERDELVGIWGSCTDITERVEMERSMVAVLEDQQERIGRDLHDSVGQLLTGVRMLSEGLASAAPDGAETTLARISAYSAEALDRVRAICRGLVPPQLYSEGVAWSLAELVDHVDALGPTRCLFRHDGRADLFDPEVSLQVYRIVQEAVSNALRHANAETVWVYFGHDEDDLVVEVEDDGVGFVLDGERARSLGLYSMNRRAHSVGASLVIETRPGSGTTVRVTLPPGAVSPRHGPPEGPHGPGHHPPGEGTEL
jgi:PAS domain S-box-containing protein